MDPTTPGWNLLILLICIGVVIKWIWESYKENTDKAYQARLAKDRKWAEMSPEQKKAASAKAAEDFKKSMQDPEFQARASVKADEYLRRWQAEQASKHEAGQSSKNSK